MRRLLLTTTSLLLVNLIPMPISAADSPPAASAPSAPSAVPEPWSIERCREILDRTLTVRLAPDLSVLSPAERAAIPSLLAVGEIFQRLYEEAKHSEAQVARDEAELFRLRSVRIPDDPVACRVELYRIFQGPIATTLENRREPFLAVAPEAPGKNVYPPGITAEEVERYLAAHPEERAAILGERTAVRRATRETLATDLGSLARYPVPDTLHPGLADRLRALAARPDAATLYAVPYSVAWSDEHVTAQRLLFEAAAAVERDDAEFARYLRNRGRDLLSNDYESGDAAWVTGRFGRLNAQIGAYETYDDALFGVKAFPSFSVLLRDVAASADLARGLAGLQEVEDALPYTPHKRVRADIPVGAYEVVADFGQARGTNTASILPNDPLFARRYGRTILLRGNIMTDPALFAVAERRWRAAVAPAHANALALDGGYQRTLWHEVGHYLGPDRTRDGRSLAQALAGWADTLEELKADLVSLFAVQRFAERRAMTRERLAGVQADGVLRTLLSHRPRPDQPYQRMELVQFNWFLDRGLLAPDSEGRLEIRIERYPEAVASLLEQVLALQIGGDPRAAEAFFERWSAWSGSLHEPLAKRLRAAEGARYRRVRYAALGE